MRKIGIALTVGLLVGPAGLVRPAAQEIASPLTGSMRGYYDNIKTWMIKSAEVMPEKDYAFHPATMPASDNAEIRTFGGLIGHVAQENFTFCAAAAGLTPPAESQTIDKKTNKAELQQALADSFAYCDRAWDGTTDENAATSRALPFNLGKSTRLGTLVFNTTHDSEHYGNVVTYLRARGIVPPSSAK